MSEFKCVCGFDAGTSGYLCQHQVACSWAIRDERDNLKRELSDVTELHAKIADDCDCVSKDVCCVDIAKKIRESPSRRQS